MPDFYFEYDALSRTLAIRVTGAFNDATMKACYTALSSEVAAPAGNARSAPT